MNRTPGARCKEVLLRRRRRRRQHQWQRPTGAGRRRRRFSSPRPVVARAPCPPSESSRIVVCHSYTLPPEVFEIYVFLPVSLINFFYFFDTLTLVCAAIASSEIKRYNIKKYIILYHRCYHTVIIIISYRGNTVAKQKNRAAFGLFIFRLQLSDGVLCVCTTCCKSCLTSRVLRTVLFYFSRRLLVTVRAV